MTSAAVSGKAKKVEGVTSDSHHLFEAVKKGKIHLTRFILAASTTRLANSWDQDGKTPLIACCDIKEEGTRDQIVQILLEGGADVNMMDTEKRSPLIHACEKRCNDIVRLLIHHHKIKPDLEDQYGNTALIYSAAVGNDVATELLTRHFRRLGLQVDHYNRQGNTALHLAVKNHNLNCAKILAQKGRASVSLKDREHGLTALEWSLRKGFDKDEVDFLKPTSRFYRVAKLATSLSRHRTSVSSLEAKSKVSPSKAVDGSKSRMKVTLSRSKSQAAEAKTQGRSAGVLRQSTMDSATLKSRQKMAGKPTENRSLHIAGKNIKELIVGKEDRDKGKAVKQNSQYDRSMKHLASESDTAAPNEDDNHEGASSMKIRKYLPGTCAAAYSAPVSGARQEAGDGSVSGRLTGLGCSLSVTSMASSTTSLESTDGNSDCSDHSSVLEDVSVSFEALSTDTVGASDEKGAQHSRKLDSGFTQTHSSDVMAAPMPHSVPDRSSPTEVSMGNATDHTSGQDKNAPLKTDGKSTPTSFPLKRNPGLRDVSCNDVFESLDEELEDISLSRDPYLPHTLTPHVEEERPGEQHSDSGQGTAGRASSVQDYRMPASSGRQPAPILSHMRGPRQISQDA